MSWHPAGAPTPCEVSTRLLARNRLSRTSAMVAWPPVTRASSAGKRCPACPHTHAADDVTTPRPLGEGTIGEESLPATGVTGDARLPGMTGRDGDRTVVQVLRRRRSRPCRAAVRGVIRPRCEGVTMSTEVPESAVPPPPEPATPRRLPVGAPSSPPPARSVVRSLRAV